LSGYIDVKTPAHYGEAQCFLWHYRLAMRPVNDRYRFLIGSLFYRSMEFLKAARRGWGKQKHWLECEHPEVAASLREA
jgi:hypothetical protein